MATFRKSGSKEVPAIKTSSLPDIVFMILMFFMVSTSMRQSDRLVKVTLPQASEIVKLERKDLYHIFMSALLWSNTEINMVQTVVFN